MKRVSIRVALINDSLTSPHSYTRLTVGDLGMTDGWRVDCLYFCAGCQPIDENLMEKTIEALECQCHKNMKHAIATEEGLGIEYDEDVICDVCRSPYSEDGNDMVFCDKCNICVHQVSASGGRHLPMLSLAGAQSSSPAPISG